MSQYNMCTRNNPCAVSPKKLQDKKTNAKKKVYAPCKLCELGELSAFCGK